MNKLRNTGIRFLRFATVGAIATGIHYLIVIVLVDAVNMEAVRASSIGFVISAILNYQLNYRYTYHSKVEHRGAIIKFFVVASVGLVLNATTMHVVTEVGGVHYMLAQLIATLLVLVWNFAGNGLWTFKPA